MLWCWSIMAAPWTCVPCRFPRRLQNVSLAAAAIILAGIATARDVHIKLEGGIFRVDGWNVTEEPAQGWSSVFPVYAGESSSQPMLGSYEVTGHVLTFHPRFPLSPGVRFRAVFTVGERVEATFESPIATNPLTR